MYVEERIAIGNEWFIKAVLNVSGVDDEVRHDLIKSEAKKTGINEEKFSGMIERVGEEPSPWKAQPSHYSGPNLWQ